MVEPIIPLIMCGGAGTRLWPASREDRPKQFLRLLGRYSSFQESIRRFSESSLFQRPIAITNQQYRFLVAEQLAEIGAESDIVLEPSRRDSGPAIAAGATLALRRDDDPVVLVLAADHIIADTAGFVAACQAARAAADNGRIVTFGVRPTGPVTGYGYISPGDAIDRNVFAVNRFVEKPDELTAKRYFAEGYLWNSGNFMFRASVFLEEYRKFDGVSADAIATAVEKTTTDLGFVALDSKAFMQAKSISVDYAVMETKPAVVAPVSFGWSDIGSWETVWELADKDDVGNAARGPAIFHSSQGSYVASDKALVALLGVEDLVVIASEDAVLVARRKEAAGLKDLVARIRDMSPEVVENHLKVHRPWGTYQSIDRGERFHVKRIVVKPGGRLSLQMHHHRAEHWVVVKGSARVTIGYEMRIVQENQSTYIPTGEVHRLENPGKIDLELIEVQTGSYLEEDDIVRLEDDFRRE